ncbi:efflux RND transporter periplasmic adaptor subunit [uncultured Marixanthomonas sp.]|uniref:efflux RND transporter periplasmic adaptor subunit n=1 Tax=uncultured Marixanthomonas sp. TaxID=757245 RepID=UPI0030D8E6C7|tara:strand:+ start:142837 stop:144045 length:1209 start_codon:yes stop_codon:yes gene_type:complete
MKNKKILLICLVILLAAVAITFLIFFTEPTAESEGATKQTAMLVNTVEVKKGDYQPTLQATGTVQPVEDVMLSPLVSGQIIRRPSNFTPGSFVKKGQTLLQIDPSDFRNTLELRQSELLQAQTNLEVEMGRQQVAEKDLELAGIDSLSDKERQLVLRRPQLDAVRATVKAAKASVNQAETNITRTTIKAPFDAHVISQNVTEGSQVAPGDNLGRLVGSDYYWITVTVPVSQLKWLTFPNTDSEKGSMVKIKHTTAWEKDTYRVGYLNKQIGALDNQTRMARVLVKVPDPLGYESDTKLPKLIIGSFVEVHLEAKTIEDIVRLDRGYVRSNQTVWVMDEGKLSIRKVDIVLTDSKYAYIRSGLEDSEKVVTTNLSTVAEGIALRNEATDSIQNSTQNKNKEEQ